MYEFPFLQVGHQEASRADWVLLNALKKVGIGVNITVSGDLSDPKKHRRIEERWSAENLGGIEWISGILCDVGAYAASKKGYFTCCKNTNRCEK